MTEEDADGSGARRSATTMAVNPDLDFPARERRRSQHVVEGPALVDAMTPRQKCIYRSLVSLWAASVIWFWAWWLQTEHWITPFGMAINSLLLVWTTLLPGWFFAFVGRMKRPNPALPVLPFRTAIIVTKAPSEPWDIVRATLEGMLRQDYPHPYDTWLADEDPADETVAWCRARGVRISTRRGVPEYHRPTWPRRTKCKEGNLAYFYDQWGYSDYDVVVQLDADHVPTPSYLAAMVRPFSDLTVGYVAAPSICDKNSSESWSVRGRLFKEATLHGALQAGYNGGYAPSCIGSHYAVRTAALREVGGLGPELAEDFSTTLMLASAGWRGVFAIDAEAHGDGPETFADCIVQEFQWARSLTNILLRFNRGYWGGLTGREKVKLGFNEILYPVYAFHMLGAFVLPIWALLTNRPWVFVQLPEFFLHMGAISAGSLVTVAWLRRQGWLRPVNSKLLCWEVVLFQFTRWPWIAWGVAHSIVGTLLKRDFGFKVTPKGTSGPKKLPLVTVLPYLVLALVSAATAISVGDPGTAWGYYYFCVVNALLYFTIAATVVVLHVRENPVPSPLQLVRLVGGHATVVVGTAAAVAVAGALRGPDAVRVLVPPAYADAGRHAVARAARTLEFVEAPPLETVTRLVFTFSVGMILVAVLLSQLMLRRPEVRQALLVALPATAVFLAVLGVRETLSVPVDDCANASNCRPAPTLIVSRGGRAVARVEVGSDGSFRVPLTAGSYSVAPIGGDAGRRHVTVHGGAWSRVMPLDSEAPVPR